MIPRRRMATVRFAMKAPQSESWTRADFGSSRRTGLRLAAACAVVLIGCSESPPDSPEPIRNIVMDPAELIDILPTLLALVGAEPFDAAQGRSLVSAMSARQDGEHTPGPHESSHDERGRLALGWWPDPEQLPLRSVVQGD
jgi:hypothetical protein